MNKENYITYNSANFHFLTLDSGSKKFISGSFPVEVFYILSGDVGLYRVGKPSLRFSTGECFEIVNGEEAEIASHSSLEILHLALPYHLENYRALNNISRQVYALQYFTKNKLSEITMKELMVCPDNKKVEVKLNNPENFGISKPEKIQKDSEVLFKTILKNYLYRQRKKI